jgi:sarcosine oxidase/L-pipecolate oxidase
MKSSFSPPSSIIIIGSGVFGLSTAYSLAQRPDLSQCSITVISKPGPSGPDGFPPPEASSMDSSRIIRADYADPAYAQLAADSLDEWRRSGPDDLGGSGRYHEDGLILVADEGSRGLAYVRDSWENAKMLAAKDATVASTLTLLPNQDAIRQALGTAGTSGTWGYFNGRSGWADAAASMRWLYERVQATRRVTFVSGTAEAMLHNDTRVTGVRLREGHDLIADLTVLAAGAWSPSLLDLRGQAVATGQVIAYMDLTDDEQHQLQSMPTILNLTSGVFVITPANKILKVARHAYGYLNPVPAYPLQAANARLESRPNASTLPVSIPLTSASVPDLDIPLEGSLALREALHDMVPLPSLKDRPFCRTRLCWYTDTPTGDFLIDYHPEWQGLFVATGGSGHAFKFLPVLGDKIVDCILGRDVAGLKEQWSWKRIAVGRPSSDDAAIATEDGSRGGVPGLLLVDELAKDSRSCRGSNESSPLLTK